MKNEPPPPPQGRWIWEDKGMPDPPPNKETGELPDSHYGWQKDGSFKWKPYPLPSHLKRPERAGLETIHDSIDYDSKLSVFWGKHDFKIITFILMTWVAMFIYVIFNEVQK
jgi:hypothetical protein